MTTRITLALATFALAAWTTAPAQNQGPVKVVSPDQTREAAVVNNVQISVSFAPGGKAVWISQGHSAKVTSLAYSPDNKLLASAGEDRAVLVWEAATGRQMLRLTVKNPVSNLRFTADGRTLSGQEADQTVRQWDVATGKMLQ